MVYRINHEHFGRDVSTFVFGYCRDLDEGAHITWVGDLHLISDNCDATGTRHVDDLTGTVDRVAIHRNYVGHITTDV